MAPAVQSMVATTYVRDIDTSRGFYELLGFSEHSAGRADTSAWSYLSNDEHFILLASTKPALEVPQLPLLFYFYYEDVDAVVRVLRDAGLRAEHLGHPPHALGGEIKVLDPDGNTVLLGQHVRSASQPEPETERSLHFSLLKEAAALVAAHGGTTFSCQVMDRDGAPCPARAEIKIADTAGEAAWACLRHADELLLAVPGAFIASQGEPGITGFLSGRQ